MSNLQARLRTGIGGGVIFFGLYIFFPSFFVCLLASLVGYMAFVEWPRVASERARWYVALTQIDGGLIYPLLPLILLLVHVVQWRGISPWYGVYPFLAAWLVDAVAYGVGTRWGRHLCWPTISPRKTWEGAAAGVTALVLVHCFLWVRGKTTLALWQLVLGGLLVAMVAILGDLLMSWYKRQQGVKDTGSMLPGHGGLLDRFDSVLAVVTVIKLLEALRAF